MSSPSSVSAVEGEVFTHCVYILKGVGGIIGISCMFKAVGFMPQTMNYLCVYE